MLSKENIPISIRKSMKSALNWRHPGNFSQSVAVFIGYRGLFFKRFIITPVYRIFFWRYYSKESRLLNEVKKDNRFIEKNFKIDREVGFAKINLDSELTSSAVNFAQTELKRTKGQSKYLGDKDYLRAISTLDDVPVNSDVFKLFTSSEVLNPLTEYLGITPALIDITVLYSPEARLTDIPNARFQGSQLFHRDGDGPRLIKIWVLCNEVTNENGPTVLIPAKISNQIARKIRYKQGYKIEDDSIFYEHENKFFYAIGSAGTTLATDTISCFHMGSRTIKESSRLVMMAQYVSPYSSYLLPKFGVGLPRKYSFAEYSDKLSEEAKILLRYYL